MHMNTIKTDNEYPSIKGYHIHIEQSVFTNEYIVYYFHNKTGQGVSARSLNLEEAVKLAQEKLYLKD